MKQFAKSVTNVVTRVVRLVPLFFVLFVSTGAQALPSQSMHYQAFLKDGAGLPVNATQSMTFRLYDAAVGGNLLWSDTLSVNVSNGLLSVELGTPGNPLPKSAFANGVWLGIEVGSDGEAVPRTALNSQNNAFRAEEADSLQGQSAASLDQSADVAGNTAAISTNSGNIATNAANLATHAASASAHHTKTSLFSELTGVIAPAQIADGSIGASKIDSLGLNADTLDGISSSGFMLAGTDRWVNTTGDTMSGNLVLGSGSRLGIGVVSPVYDLQVAGTTKLGSRINFGTAEYIEDGGANTISTGGNALTVGGRLNANGGIYFPDGSRQTKAGVDYANHIVVARTGGDYTTIQAAVNAANPTVDNPVLIEVMPGVYNENVTLKSYIHLKGAGVEQTTIYTPPVTSATTDADFSAIYLNNLTGVVISDMTLYGGSPANGDPVNGGYGIFDLASSPVIRNMKITGFHGSGFSVYSAIGIFSQNSSPVIHDSVIDDNAYAGVYLLDVVDARVSDNRLANNIGAGTTNCAVTAERSSAIISDNDFRNNSSPICAFGASTARSSVEVSGNRMIDNGNGIGLGAGAVGSIIGNHIEVVNFVASGYGITGSRLADSTHVVGNLLIGTEFGIQLPERSIVIGNQIQPSCPGGCSPIVDITGSSVLIGNTGVDDKLASAGSLTVGSNQFIGLNLTVGNDITAGNDISGQNLLMDNDANIVNNVNVGGSVSILGDLAVSGTAAVGYERVVGAAVSLSSSTKTCGLINASPCFYATATVSCPAGKVVVGGGCYCNSLFDCGFTRNYPNKPTSWSCSAVASASSYAVTPVALCARVGG